MKTTIEIADELLQRAQRAARERDTTLRALTEEGLRLVLKQPVRAGKKRIPPLVTMKGRGLSPDFKNASWAGILAASCEGRGG